MWQPRQVASGAQRECGDYQPIELSVNVVAGCLVVSGSNRSSGKHYAAGATRDRTDHTRLYQSRCFGLQREVRTGSLLGTWAYSLRTFLHPPIAMASLRGMEVLLPCKTRHVAPSFRAYPSFLDPLRPWSSFNLSEARGSSERPQSPQVKDVNQPGYFDTFTSNDSSSI